MLRVIKSLSVAMGLSAPVKKTRVMEKASVSDFENRWEIEGPHKSEGCQDAYHRKVLRGTAVVGLFRGPAASKFPEKPPPACT